MLSQQQVMTLPAISSDLAGRPGKGKALPEFWTDVSCRWRAAALAAYALEAGEDDDSLRAELAARVRRLTGCAIPDGAITADGSARRATAVLDGEVFQLQGHELIVLRPCAHCGTGLFASPSLASRADLGYALSDWQPYHAGCEPVDPADVDW